MNEFEKWWNEHRLQHGLNRMNKYHHARAAFQAGAAAGYANGVAVMKERCAEAAEKQEKQLPSSCHMRDFHAEGYNDACEDIAAAIRGLKI